MDCKGKILVVDDDHLQVTFISDLLLPMGYTVTKAFSGEEALDLVRESKPDIVLLDVIMKGMDGHEVCEKIKSDDETKNIQVIMLTSLSEVQSKYRGLELGAVDYLTKPVDLIDLTLRLKNVMTIKAHNDFLVNYNEQLEAEVKKRTRDLDESFIDTIYRLTLAAEHKDSGTASHLKRVSHYTHFMAKEIGLGDKEADVMFHASPMHDVGKIGIPDNILKSEGAIESEDFEVMKLHTVIGSEMLAGSESEYLKSAARFAVSHHENWDGTGYPYGLKGEEIPIEGRAMIIVDRYDALRSKRPYKESFGHEKALSLLTAHEGRSSSDHFDPLILEAFQDNHMVFANIYEDCRDD